MVEAGIERTPESIRSVQGAHGGEIEFFADFAGGMVIGSASKFGSVSYASAVHLLDINASVDGGDLTGEMSLTFNYHRGDFGDGADGQTEGRTGRPTDLLQARSSGRSAMTASWQFFTARPRMRSWWGPRR